MKIFYKITTYIVIFQCVITRNGVLSLIHDDEGHWGSIGDEIDHSPTIRDYHSPLPYKFCDKGKFRFDWMRQKNNFICSSKKKSINHSYYDNDGDDDLEDHHNDRHQGRRPQRRIAGGFTPQLGEFPSFVQVIHNNGPEGRTILCGGVLINSYLVLTAAHCAESTEGLVIAGSIELARGKSSEIIQGCQPNEFPDKGDVYDWMILELKDEFHFDDNIQPGCINLDFKLNDDYVCVSVGHGKVNKTSEPSDQLRAATLQRCQMSGSPSGAMCSEMASDVDGTGLTCPGDSGGPLYCFDNCSNKPQMFVVGITQGAPPQFVGCSLNHIVYHTSMSHHRLSISSLMRQMIGRRGKRKRRDKKHRLALLDGDDPLIKSSGFKCRKYKI